MDLEDLKYLQEKYPYDEYVYGNEEDNSLPLIAMDDKYAKIFWAVQVKAPYIFETQYNVFTLGEVSMVNYQDEINTILNDL